MEEKDQIRSRQRKKTIMTISFPFLALALALTVYLYMRYQETRVSTDDAFVDGRVHVVASKIPGTVMRIEVNDNAFVRRGKIILEIDPADYEIRITDAQAGLAVEKSKLSEYRARIYASRRQLSELKASLGAARSSLAVQEANLRQAESDFKRADALTKTGVISKQSHEHTRTAYEMALAQVKAAGSSVAKSEAAIETQQAIIKVTESEMLTQQNIIEQKEAVVADAELKKAYTKLYAPTDGYVTKRSVETGNQIQPGQPLMAIVPLGEKEIWVTANYKETQLKRIRPGQKVMIKVDAFPDKEIEGRVDSIMAGTGSAFSLFPPENATGNYVKVVQRTPVKIVLPPGSDPNHLLRIGMSVEPTVLVESH